MPRTEFFVYRTVAEDFSPRAACRHSGLDPAGHAGLRHGNSISWNISAATRYSPRRCGATARWPEIEGYRLLRRED